MKTLWTLLLSLSVLQVHGVTPWFEGSLIPGNERQLITGEVLIPISQGQASVCFWNGRARFDSDEVVEGNIGLGYRSNCYPGFVFGANAFYDVKRSQRGNLFHQCSAGLEFLGDIWEFRVNGYLPGKDREVAKEALLPGEIVGLRAEENSVFCKKYEDVKLREYERALHGYDAEFGLRLPLFCSDLDIFLYAGGFRYQGRGVDTLTGPRARLELEINEPFSVFGYHGSKLTLEAIVQNDSVRNTEAFFAMRLRIPLYDGLRPQYHDRLEDRLAHRIVRHEQVVVGRIHGEKLDRDCVEEQVLNRNGDPLRIIYTNGMTTSGGAGTIEDPYYNFTDALDDGGSGLEDYDILYVQNGGIVGLSDGNYVLPSHVPHLQISGAGAPLVIEGLTLFPETTAPEFTLQPDQVGFILNDAQQLLMEGINVTPTNAVALSGEMTSRKGTDFTFRKMMVNGSDTSGTPNGERGWELTYENRAENRLVYEEISSFAYNGAIGVTNRESTLDLTIKDQSNLSSITTTSPGFGAFALNNEDGKIRLGLQDSAFSGIVFEAIQINNTKCGEFSGEFRNLNFPTPSQLGFGYVFFNNSAGAKADWLISSCLFSQNLVQPLVPTDTVAVTNEGGSQLDVTVVDSSFEGGFIGGFGLINRDPFSHVDFTMIRCSAFGYGASGVNLNSTNEAELVGTIANTSVFESGNGFFLRTDTKGSSNVSYVSTLAYNTGTGYRNVTDGLESSATVSYVDAIARNNTFGFQSETTNLGFIDATFVGCQANGNTDSGIFFFNSTGGKSNVFAKHCLLDGQGTQFRGMNFDNDSGNVVVNARIEDTRFFNHTGGGGVGFLMNATLGPQVTVELQNCTFDSNDTQDISFTMIQESDGTLNLLGGNNVPKLFIEANSTGATATANRTSDDAVGTVTESEVAPGVITLNPDPFTNP